MVAAISSTYDSKYFYYLPITAWCWHRLGVKTVCFLPEPDVTDKCRISFIHKSTNLVSDVMKERGIIGNWFLYNCPEHKEATYAQCLRNYAACLPIPDDELICSSDIDMALFQIPPYIDNGMLSVIGYDLVPQGQFPQCYIIGTAKMWRDTFGLNGKTYQQAIDELLKDDECENYRGCRWSVDQEQSFLNISKVNHNLIPRAKPGTQFAQHRVDRDDINWRAYVNEELVDAHLWRPGYTDENFSNIMELLTMKYPDENLQWLIDYNSEYKKLIP